MKRLSIYTLLAAFLATACTEEIDLPLKSQGTRMLVVEGQITSDTTAHQIKLSYTSDYYETGGSEVEGAAVSVSDGTGTYQLTEDGITPRIYPGHPHFFAVADSDEHDDNKVVSEMEKGYLLNGRLLRPSRVCVCKKTNKENNVFENNEDTGE